LKIKRVSLLAAALALSIVVAGCGIVKKNPEAEKNSAVAKVNGQVITKEEFDQEFEFYKNSFEAQYGSDIWNQDIDGRKFTDVVKEQVVEALINDRLVLEDAQKQGIEVTQQEADLEIQEIKDYYGDEQEFLELLAAQGLNEEQFVGKVKQDIIKSKYREKVLENVSVSEEDIRQYYDENTKEFKNDTVRASHILLDTREEAEEVLAKVKAGEDFNQLAEQYSVDPSAKTSMGDLGEFGYGDMIEPFEQAAFALDEGEISDIVETQFGYHIIKVFDKTIVDPSPFEEVKDGIESSLLYYEREARYSQILTEMREQADVETFPKNM
jgi:foldase protein PrsA